MLYHCRQKVTLSVERAKVEDMKTHALVSEDNSELSSTEGLAGVIKEKGGEYAQYSYLCFSKLLNDIKGYASIHGELKTGKNAVTQSGSLQASCIIHVAAPPKIKVRTSCAHHGSGLC